MLTFRTFLKFREGLDDVHKEEYDRIERELRDLRKTTDQAWDELEPLAKESATREQHEEFLPRATALLEREAERYAQLTKDLRHLTDCVAARSLKHLP